MYDYCYLTFFYSKLRCLTKNQTFSPDRSDKGLFEPCGPKTGRKRGFQGPGVVSHSFYVQLLLINLISRLYTNA